MKFVLIAASAIALTACVANEAAAFDLGNGLSIGGEVETSWTPAADTNAYGLDFTPEAAITFQGLKLSAETTFDMLELNNDAVDTFTGFDFEATYGVTDNLTAFGEVSTDADNEFGDITIGTRLSF